MVKKINYFLILWIILGSAQVFSQDKSSSCTIDEFNLCYKDFKQLRELAISVSDVSDFIQEAKIFFDLSDEEKLRLSTEKLRALIEHCRSIHLSKKECGQNYKSETLVLKTEHNYDAFSLGHLSPRAAEKIMKKIENETRKKLLDQYIQVAEQTQKYCFIEPTTLGALIDLIHCSRENNKPMELAGSKSQFRQLVCQVSIIVYTNSP